MAVAISFATVPTVARSETVGPLFELLSRIPLDARGMVTLNDYAAVAAQSAPFTVDLAPDHPNRRYLSFGTLAAPYGFDVNVLFEFPDGAVDALGFSIFEIGQMAGWGENPDVGLALTGVVSQPQRIRTALLARGFFETTIRTHVVWHRQDDFQVDIKRRIEEPFSGMNRTSERFSIVGDHLLFSRSWQVMRQMLDASKGLDTDIDASAILQAGYQFESAGTLVSAFMMAGQPPRPLDSADTLDQADLPGLPEFPRYGLLLWQNGATMTGAIAIPFTSADIAQSALASFSARLAVVQSPSVRRPMTELLPKERRFKVIETDQRDVLILAFEQTHTVARPIGLGTFVGNPFQRLVTMFYRDELGSLIGH